MNILYNIRGWLHECDRFLFLAEVRSYRKDVDLSGHRFTYEITSSCMEGMFNKARDMQNGTEYCINVEEWVTRDEFCILKETLDVISSDYWENIDMDSIKRAQDIVHKIADAVNSDILKTHELRGHPSIYNACRIR